MVTFDYSGIDVHLTYFRRKFWYQVYQPWSLPVDQSLWLINVLCRTHILSTAEKPVPDIRYRHTFNMPFDFDMIAASHYWKTLCILDCQPLALQFVLILLLIGSEISAYTHYCHPICSNFHSHWYCLHIRREFVYSFLLGYAIRD